MSKKHFIELADTIRFANKFNSHCFTEEAIKELPDFCKRQNPSFNREIWLDYIAGKCGPNGGAVK
jgi:hypothetical protein